MKPTYQLTRYMSGSFRELAVLSLPVMIYFGFDAVALFIERMLLTQQDIHIANGVTNALLIFYAISMIPWEIASFSEVFCGNHHGASQMDRVGKSAWQALWICLFMFPICWFIAPIAGNWLFVDPSTHLHAKDYFFWSLVLFPFFMMESALAGFFIAVGRVSTPSICNLIGVGVHILLDFVFILGWGPFAPMGATGAALAFGISQIITVALMAIQFYSNDCRQKYHTSIWPFDIKEIREYIVVGTPSGAGQMNGTVAHFLFNTLLLSAGVLEVAAFSIASSLLSVLIFISEGLSRSVATLASNLLGARKHETVRSVMSKAFILHALFAFPIIFVLCFCPQALTWMFELEDITALESSSRWTMAFVGLFFLIDGWNWSLMGVLTAAKKTPWIFGISAVGNYLLWIVPSYLYLHYFKWDPNSAWIQLFIQGVAMLGIYLVVCRRLTQNNEVSISDIAHHGVDPEEEMDSELLVNTIEPNTGQLEVAK